MRYVTSAALRKILQGQIKYGATQTDLAAELGVSRSYLCDFLQGNREVGPTILKALGYDPTPYYRAIDSSSIAAEVSQKEKK
jgi:transcriptional regulator with XRE-family HTH domain